jgi:phosphoglycerate dehydrogenase-like enzyme
VHRLAGRTLGLVGFGASARGVALRARGFGLHLIAWVRSPDKYRDEATLLGVELVTVEQLFRQSDFVSIHLPLSSETRHFIGVEKLAMMKPTAVIINTARGAIIDESALVQALQNRRIGGAALDVFEEMDVFALPGTPCDHPLLKLDNVILTPHCAGSSVESTYDSKVRGARHAVDVLSGRWPPFVVNPEVEPRWPLTRSAPPTPRRD